MLSAAGASATTAVVDTDGSTEKQWTQTSGGTLIQWISGRAPAGGFTLTTTDISIWAHESGTAANAGGRYRLFKRSVLGIETELLPAAAYDDGVEFTKTTPTEMAWTGDPTDTVFLEDERILLKLYITNVGSMGTSQTCTLTYDAADAATGDAFLNIAETVTFKAEDAPSLEGEESYAGVSLVNTVTGIARAALASTLLTAAIGFNVANGDREELPAGSLVNAPNSGEDYWQIVQDYPPLRGLPYLPDGDDFPVPAAAALEEGEWNAPPPVAASIYQTFPYLPDAEEIPGSLSGQPDEDFWQNPVSPVPATLFQVLPYLPDAQDLPAGSLYGEPLEDYWLNPVFPVCGSLHQPLPYSHDAGEIIVVPSIGTDEDFWASPVPILIQQAKNLPLLLWDSGEIGILTFSIEDDYWQNWVLPVPARMFLVFPHLPDRENRSYGPVQGAEAFEVSANPDVIMSISVWTNVEMDID